MGASGKRSFSVWSVGRTINQGTASDKLVSHSSHNDHNHHNGHVEEVGPALKRLRDDHVLGCGDEASEATRRRAAWRQVVLSRIVLLCRQDAGSTLT